MNQVYKAKDSLDGVVSYFYFDGNGKVTVIDAEDREVDFVIRYFKVKGADWVDNKNARKRMVKPVLIAEW